MDWQNPKNKQFVEDMEAAGYIAQPYSGRGMFGRACPAIVCKRSEMQSAMRCTDVKVMTDCMGMDMVLYTGLGEKQEPASMDEIEHDEVEDMGEWNDSAQAHAAKREAESKRLHTASKRRHSVEVWSNESKGWEPLRSFDSRAAADRCVSLWERDGYKARIV